MKTKVPNTPLIKELDKQIAELQARRTAEVRTHLDNETFRHLSKEKQRVLVAEDVIARVMSGQYVALKGTWVEADLPGEYKGEDVLDEMPLQPLLKDGTSCKVCGLGALAVSCIVKNNRATVEDLGTLQYIGNHVEDSEAIPGGLNKIFPKKQLKLIETAFETGSGAFNDEEGPAFVRAYEFGQGWYNSEDRLLAIMKNIVKNNGTFVP